MRGEDGVAEVMAGVMTNQCSIISTVNSGEGHHQTRTLSSFFLKSINCLLMLLLQDSEAVWSDSLNLCLGLTDDLSSFDLDILPVFG